MDYYEDQSNGLVSCFKDYTLVKLDMIAQSYINDISRAKLHIGEEYKGWIFQLVYTPQASEPD